MTTQTQIGRRLFELGDVVGTPAALKACSVPRQLECLGLHLSGEWGCVCADDRATNDDALEQGGRILSAYAIDQTKPCMGWGDNTLWIITEADRSVTTLLLPDEY